MFLVPSDYKTFIREDALDELVDQNPESLENAEKIAIEEAAGYIRHRYDEAKVFASVKPFLASSNYIAGDSIYIFADQYVRKAYALNDTCEQEGICYINTTAITVPEPFTPSKWTKIAKNGAVFTAIADASGIDISDEAKFKKTDSRNPKMVQVVVDILLYHLHSAISPRNIPTSRAVRYDGQGNVKDGESAISYLLKVQKGTITPNLPVKVDADGTAPQSGSRPSWGFGNTSKYKH